MSRLYYVVDAFANKPYGGNPAAVVLDTVGLDDAEMQSIATEFNLSETTFVLPPTSPGADVRFRWFTPATEVSMCGHATIAGVHTLVESGRVKLQPGADGMAIGIDTLSGTLTASAERIPGADAGLMIWLEMPEPVISPSALPVEAMAKVLGVSTSAIDPSLPAVQTQDKDTIVFVRDVMTLNGLTPEFGAMKNLQLREGLRGMCVATTSTLSPSIHVQSRFFAPAAGVDEDPVTGSVHGPLAAFLVAHGKVPIQGDTAALKCIQQKAGGRTGVLYALVKSRDGGRYSVRIGGQAVTVMKGTIGRSS